MRLEKHPAVGCFLRAAPSIELGKGKQFRALRSDFETAFAVEGMALEGTEFAIRPDWHRVERLQFFSRRVLYGRVRNQHLADLPRPEEPSRRWSRS